MDLSKFAKKTNPSKTQSAAETKSTAPEGASLTPRGFLAGLNGSKPFNYGNPWFREGRYRCEVLKCRHRIAGRSQKPMFVAEMKVLEVLDTKGNQSAHKVGELADWGQMLDNPMVARPALAGFALACGDPKSQEEYDYIVENQQEILEIACGPDNTMAGTVVDVDAVPIVTQVNKKHITVCRFSAPPTDAGSDPAA